MTEPDKTPIEPDPYGKFSDDLRCQECGELELRDEDGFIHPHKCHDPHAEVDEGGQG